MLTRRDMLRRAAGLAFGVVAFSHVDHLGFTEPAHALGDGALAFPLAVIAVAVASRSPSRRGQALTAGILFALMLVPAAGVHRALDEAVRGPHTHLSAAANAPGLSHHVTDAARALPVALLLTFAGLRTRRRRVIVQRRRLALAAAVAVFGATLGLPAARAALPVPFSVEMTTPPVLTGSSITLTADEADVPILPGTPTRMWTYNGVFPGPTIRVPSGSPVNVTVQNRLDTAGAITLHHHGNHSTSPNDGQPAGSAYLIEPGADRTYTYDLVEDGVPERPALQWYHDHRMDLTARNVWMGLAGMVIVDPAPGDPETLLKLPSGDYDVPIMLTDRTFDSTNQIPYTFDVNGVQGNLVLANGAPQPYFRVEPRRYRIRLLNASNTRPYQLSLDNTLVPMTQIGTESGLLPARVARTSLRLDPAERAEVVLDFTDVAGQKIVMKNTLGFQPGVSQVMRFDVDRPLVGTDDSAVPLTLRPAPEYGDALTLPSVDEDGKLQHLRRVWLLTQTGIDAPHWTINGLEYNPARVDARPVLGTVEKWVFVNTTSVEHVVHIHDVDWRILARTTGLPPDLAVEQASPTLPVDAIDPAEAGLKESFLVRPFETVEVAARFTDHLGVYVFHCHILEHEDHAMMAQFEVTAAS